MPNSPVMTAEEFANHIAEVSGRMGAVAQGALAHAIKARDAARDLVIRAAVVEECARVVADYDSDESLKGLNAQDWAQVCVRDFEIAKSIRALKEPPAPSGEEG